MKAFFVIAYFFITTSSTCNKTTGVSAAGDSNCYKARLAIKGMCMNYVIEVTGGDLTKLKLEKKWIDESNGKTYTNVFALGSRCTFPDLNEGDAFYFSLTEKAETDCNVCMAYRPVPAARNTITVSKAPCP